MISLDSETSEVQHPLPTVGWDKMVSPEQGKARAEKRANMTLDERKVEALEDIADALQMIKSEFVSFSRTSTAAARTQSSYTR